MVSRFPGSRPPESRRVELRQANLARNFMAMGQVGKENPEHQLNDLIPRPQIEVWNWPTVNGKKKNGKYERMVMRVGGNGPDRTRFRKKLTQKEKIQLLREKVPGIK